MKPVMYIVLNAGAEMSAGKLAAQAAHAAVEAYELSEDNNTRRVWYRGGHYMKVVLRATDEDDLLVKERYINDRGFKTSLIIDEGRTEIDPFTPTAIGVEILDKDNAHVAATFSTFELYREDKHVVSVELDPEDVIREILKERDQQPKRSPWDDHPIQPRVPYSDPLVPAAPPWSPPRIWCGGGRSDVRVTYEPPALVEVDGIYRAADAGIRFAKNETD